MMEKLSQVYSLLACKSNGIIFCTAYWRCLLKYVCFLSILFGVPVVQAAELYQKCVDGRVCTGPYGKDCTTRTYCTWVLGDPPVYTPPPSSTPPTPNPNTGGVGSSSPVKSVAEIEREAHVNFCKGFPVRIAAAVADCSASAKGYRSYVVNVKCASSAIITWDLKFSRDGLESGFSTTFSPGGDCRDNAQIAMEATVARCESKGLNVSAVLAQQCVDVN